MQSDKSQTTDLEKWHCMIDRLSLCRKCTYSNGTAGMKWFGERAFALICDDVPHAATPVGDVCQRCDEPITQSDSGFLIPHIREPGRIEERPHHAECHIRVVIGGVNHLLGNCICCGGTEPPDPPSLTKREAALAAVAIWAQRQ